MNIKKMKSFKEQADELIEDFLRVYNFPPSVFKLNYSERTESQIKTLIQAGEYFSHQLLLLKNNINSNYLNDLIKEIKDSIKQLKEAIK